MTGVTGIYLKRGAIVVLSSFVVLLMAPFAVGMAVAALPDDPYPLERLFSFGPDGSEATDFGRIDSIALDQQDDQVYVLSADGAAGTLSKFDPDGDPVDFEGTSSYIEGNRISGLDPFQNEYVASTQVAVDSSNHVIYVTETDGPDAIRAFEADGEPAEFTAGPGNGTSEIPGFTELISIAVDANGAIYAADRSGRVDVFAATGEPLTSFAVEDLNSVLGGSLGVSSTGAVFVLVEEKAIKKFTPDFFPVFGGTTYSESTFVSATSGALIGSFGVDRANDDLYVVEWNSAAQRAWLRRYNQAGATVESFGAPDTSTESSSFGAATGSIAIWEEGKEITVGEAVKAYVGDDDELSSPDTSIAAALGRRIVIGPPEIENTSVRDVTADSAKLRAWVDPNTAETTYHFEYGLEDCALLASTCTSVPLAEASAGAGEQPVEVSHSIFGLQPNTTYHFRVLATNSLGPTVEGPSRTFTTQPLGIGFKLIDSRVWEMVSPPDKRGAALKGTQGGLVQAASDGAGLAYLSLGSIELDPPGNRAPEFSAVLAQRRPGGWHSQDISLPNDEVIPVGAGSEGEYKFFSPDLSAGIVMPRGSTLLSPLASERTPYLRQHDESPVYTPLLTGKEGFANVPLGTEFGGSPDVTNGVVIPLGATSDLSHVVLRSELSVPLVAGLDLPDPPVALYLWRKGQLQPISELPAGSGSMETLPELGSKLTSIQHAISADGSRVFWGQLADLDDGALYMRDTIAEKSVRLDVLQGGAGTGGARPVFQGANADGTAVFFTDTRRLTPDASTAGRDLYRCEIPSGTPAAGCANLTNLSAPLAGSGESADVLGRVSGLSEDGTRIYFVAEGVLDNAPNQYGDSALPGEPNLYLWEEGEGVRFVGTLADEDKGTWGMRNSATSRGSASKLSATVSPGSRYFVFMSERSLSGYVNLEATNGKPVQEVFRYDAVTEDLDCLSCDPFGAAPEGEEPVSRPLVNPGGMYDGVQTAAALPGPFRNELGLSPYRARTALDNGRVFFNAVDSLVPADSNGEWDVYQWEPIGVGSCIASLGDVATTRSAGGCISLLSSGTAEEEAAFIDASVSGDDAFLLTPARLSVIDRDDELDVYDARIGGVEATLQPHSECQGEACRSTTGPPSDPIPGSATFLGPGNAKPEKGKRCPKGKRKVRAKGRVRCVPRKRPQRHRKTSPNRGMVR